MKSIRLKNIRSIEDSGYIELKPLTIVLGENSSGKSTFCRIFPLLRQSRMEAPQGPILFNGELVDFGSLKNVISRGSGSNDITLSFVHVFRNADFPFYSKKDNAAPLELEVDFVVGDIGGNIPYVKSIFARFRNFKIEFHFDNNRVVKVVSGEYDFSEYFSDIFAFDDGRFFPILLEKNDGIIEKAMGKYRRLIEITSYSKSASLPRKLSSEFNSIIKSYHRKNASEIKVIYSENLMHNLAFNGGYQPPKGIGVRLNDALTKMLKQYQEGRNRDFDRLTHISAVRHSLSILESFNSHIDLTSKNIRYIAPLRATAERYYRARNTSVREVDSRGNNLPVFISSLPSYELDNLQAWCLDNFDINLIVEQEGGHLSLFIQHDGSDNLFNLTDTGFGYSQVMPILVQLWSLINQKSKSGISLNFPVIYVIEQPELHLHPRMQAIIADVFCRAVAEAKKQGVDLRLLVETHSESIINKVGHAVRNVLISSDDVKIVVFNKKNKDLYTDFSHVAYKEDGQLENWPWGFFD